jgi:hypothetical protein
LQALSAVEEPLNNKLRPRAHHQKDLNVHNNRRFRCSSLLLSGLLMTFTTSSHAVINASSGVSYADPHTASLTAVYGTSGPLSAAGYTSSGGLMAADGYGEAAYGALHASSSAIVTGDGQTRGQGSAYWIDNATLSSSSFAGGAIARVSFDLSGGLSSMTVAGSIGALANSTIAATVKINGSTVFSVTGQLVSRNGAIETDYISVNGDNLSYTPGSLAGRYSFDVPVTLGTSFQLMADLSAGTQAMGSSGIDIASAHSNFGSTAYWGGISDVHLTNGTLVSDYRVSSSSGFDWGNAYASVAPPLAVPEPATYALMLAGLGLLGVVTRRRKSRK